MRIAVTNWSLRRAGGVETYLSHIIPALIAEGHDVAVLAEIDEPRERGSLLSELPDVQRFCLAMMGREPGLAALSKWRPDVICGHGMLDPAFERESLRLAPSVFFAHNYYGTCISGLKTRQWPVAQPCNRRFGAGCLLHYYPRRCGGLNPITMVREYSKQRRRLNLLFKYDAVITHSNHMYSEYAKHGIPPKRLHQVAYYSPGDAVPSAELNHSSNGGVTLPVVADALRHLRAVPEPVRLTFMGRMDALKGGGQLIEALPMVADMTGRSLHVTLAGDGEARTRWHEQARELQARRADIEIRFPGWLGRADVGELLDDTDLVVFPSIWPEPFGLVGTEAGRYGIPVAAFSVGGIRDWLIDGVNGHLAPGDPPTKGGLAHAIVKCIRDPATYERLSRGAAELAHHYNRESHVPELTAVFESVQSKSYSRLRGCPNPVAGSIA